MENTFELTCSSKLVNNIGVNTDMLQGNQKYRVLWFLFFDDEVKAKESAGQSTIPDNQLEE